MEQVNGHWYIDGKYGYGGDQRICTDVQGEDEESDTCMGVVEEEPEDPEPYMTHQMLVAEQAIDEMNAHEAWMEERGL